MLILEISSCVFRNLLRLIRNRPTFVALNVGNLTLGLTTFLVLLSISRSEFVFDRWIPAQQGVFRIDAVYQRHGQNASEFPDAPYRLFDELKASLPEILSASRYAPESAVATLHGVLVAQDVQFVDPDFLNVVQFPLGMGDAGGLSRPDGAIVSDKIARQYFGSARAAMGRVLNLNIEQHAMRFTVRGVLAPIPAATTIHPDILLAMPTWVQELQTFQQWGMTAGKLYVRVLGTESPAELTANLRRFISAHAGSFLKIGGGLDVVSIALADQHAHDDQITRHGAGGDAALALGGIGTLALCASVINAVNLLTALAFLRGREIAVRKTLGATSFRVAVECLTEATGLVAMAGVPALSLAELAIPAVDALGGWSAAPGYGWMLALTALVIVPTGLLAGFYPALVLARVRPATMLAASRSPGIGRMGASVRTILVGFQFAFAVGLSICALVVLAQSRFETTASLGFAHNGIVSIGALDAVPKQGRQPMLDAIGAIPGVMSVTTGWSLPGDGGFASGGIVSRVDMPDRRVDISWQETSGHYAETMGIKVLAGRTLDAAHGLDDTPDKDAPPGTTQNIMIDANLAAKLGYASPYAALGARLKFGNDSPHQLVVVGVLDNVRFASSRGTSEPAIYFYQSRPYDYASGLVRVKGRPTRDVITDLERVWREHAPGLVFEAQTVEAMMADAATPERALALLMVIGSGVAGAISAMGAYGLASFDVARRRFEIGLRRTLGATTGQVLRLMLGRFLRPVWPACAVGSVLAGLLMRNWLAGFSLRIALSPLPFLLCSTTAVALCVLTVGGHTWRLVMLSPASTLREE